ncbi:hypothetical protein NC653_020459 [Populus alba x Populus x berolinensis]|uniref:Uncharacterized protein n=1 Tax=Populus alba x Populus x berolinensis TaxID=444605 RepID=A0AAD6MKL3_9ROSI|nr:hypothetical protein NC653_020459 [Populus alba x Populus x berolinensis]
MPSATSVTIVSQCNVFPDQKSTLEDLKLSVSDLPMLSCQYIQKGGLFTRPPTLSVDSLISHLKQSLFSNSLSLPSTCRGFFAFESTVSYQGHYKPILAVQVTELADGVFIGCSMNHSVTDGTSFWTFFNTFSEVSRGIKKISRQPDFSRNSILISEAALKVPQGGPQVTFNENEPLCERIFSFSREAILKLKSKVNNKKWTQKSDNTNVDAVEIMGKQSNDTLLQIHNKGKMTGILESWFKNAVSKPQEMESNLSMVEISSFQSLCALLWRAVTRARKLNPSKTTTFRMAVNCRHRLNPKLDPLYFGNAIQSVPTYASAGDVLSRDLRWCAEQLNKIVAAHNDGMVRRFVEDWESNPRCFPLGNLDGASMTMGSSPRFPMEGNGTVDLEVVLAPEAMAGIESDHEFMQFVSP